MTLKLVFLFAATFYCSCAEQNTADRPPFEEDVIGGIEAPWYPFFVRLEMTNDFGQRFLCGGTIIGPKLILTAAHCVNGVPEERIEVLHANFSDPMWNLRKGVAQETHFEVEASVVHEKYSPLRLSNDIALLKLKNEIDLSDPNIGMASLCAADANYNHATAIGLGRINPFNKRLSVVLMEAQLDWKQDCGAWIQPGQVDSTKQVCFSVPGEKSACNGDSGGPLVVKEYGKVKCLLGITSFGSGKYCISFAYPGVFARAGFYADWIEANAQ